MRFSLGLGIAGGYVYWYGVNVPAGTYFTLWPPFGSVSLSFFVSFLVDLGAGVLHELKIADDPAYEAPNR